MSDTSEKTGHFASCETSCADCYDDAFFSEEERKRMLLENRIRELEAAIEAAPHGDRCSWSVWACDCWKARALKGGA